MDAKKKGGRQSVDEPSLEDIWERGTKEIRATWSEHTRKKRGGGEVDPYTVPELHVSPALADSINVGRIGRHGGY